MAIGIAMDHVTLHILSFYLMLHVSIEKSLRGKCVCGGGGGCNQPSQF